MKIYAEKPAPLDYKNEPLETLLSGGTGSSSIPDVVIGLLEKFGHTVNINRPLEAPPMYVTKIDGVPQYPQWSLLESRLHMYSGTRYSSKETFSCVSTEMAKRGADLTGQWTTNVYSTSQKAQQTCSVDILDLAVRNQHFAFIAYACAEDGPLHHLKSGIKDRRLWPVTYTEHRSMNFFESPWLNIAVAEHDQEWIKLLLSWGCDPNSTDNLQRSALFYAKHPDVVTLLMEHGADPSVVDVRNQNIQQAWENTCTAPERKAMIRAMLTAMNKQDNSEDMQEKMKESWISSLVSDTKTVVESTAKKLSINPFNCSFEKNGVLLNPLQWTSFHLIFTANYRTAPSHHIMRWLSNDHQEGVAGVCSVTNQDVSFDDTLLALSLLASSRVTSMYRGKEGFEILSNNCEKYITKVLQQQRNSHEQTLSDPQYILRRFVMGAYMLSKVHGIGGNIHPQASATIKAALHCLVNISQDNNRPVLLNLKAALLKNVYQDACTQETRERAFDDFLSALKDTNFSNVLADDYLSLPVRVNELMMDFSPLYGHTTYHALVPLEKHMQQLKNTHDSALAQKVEKFFLNNFLDTKRKTVDWNVMHNSSRVGLAGLQINDFCQVFQKEGTQHISAEQWEELFPCIENALNDKGLLAQSTSEHVAVQALLGHYSSGYYMSHINSDKQSSTVKRKM